MTMNWKKVTGVVLVALIGVLAISKDARSIASEMIVGPVIRSDGATSQIRAGREGQQITSDLTGRYFEATSRGTVFSAGTPAAGTAAFTTACPPGTGNATQPLYVFNPLGSGKQLEILKTRINWISGTPPAGGILYYGGCGLGGINSTSTNQGQAGRGALNRSSLSYAGSVTIVGSNATITFVTGTMNLLGNSLSTPFAGAVAATSVGMNTIDEIEGSYIVLPGCAIGICSAAAGTSPVINAEMFWREAAYP